MMHASFWRAVLARLPLPMLALAASYGVYSFNRLFVPVWVALVSAAAFELTYVGLALLRADDALQRRRARAISLGAVAVSVTYNTLAGLAHRAPEAFAGLPRGAEVALALLHGAPLAMVAFLVADLLLHEDARTLDVAPAQDAPAQSVAPAQDARTQDVAPAQGARTAPAQSVAPAHDARAQSVAPAQDARTQDVAPAQDARIARTLDVAPAHAARMRADDVRALALAALQAGASIAEVARTHGVNPSTLRSWRARSVAHAPAAD